MSQVKIYGLLSSLAPVMRDVSDVIQSWVVDAMHYPPNRREHVCFRWNGRNSSKAPAHDLAACTALRVFLNCLTPRTVARALSAVRGVDPKAPEVGVPSSCTSAQ